MSTLRSLTDQLRTHGYSFIAGPDMRALVVEAGEITDWPSFAASWDDLGPDAYMADGGRYRKRRHAVFAVTTTSIVRLPDRPHFQSREHNSLKGGINRSFKPMAASVGTSASLAAVLTFGRSLFTGLLPTSGWHVEVHQFRIEARADRPGRPTPEGIHRDGVDYVLVLLVNRINIASGVTSLHSPAGEKLDEFALTRPFDSALVDDKRVMHGVTPVEPLDTGTPGHRDVLVVTFQCDQSRRPIA